MCSTPNFEAWDPKKEATHGVSQKLFPSKLPQQEIIPRKLTTNVTNVLLKMVFGRPSFPCDMAPLFKVPYQTMGV